MNLAALRMLALTLATIALAPSARADEPDRVQLLELADGKFRRGLYDDAAKLYEQARPGPGSAAAYNRGCALLKAGKIPDGEAVLKDVVANADDPRIAADAAFNLGRSLHARAAVEQNPAEKLKALEQAEGAFRACVDAAPSDRDGGRALELTRQEIQKIKDEQERQKQEEKKQQDQQKQQEQQKKDEQKKQDRQKLSDQLKDLADKQDKAEQNTEQNQQKAEQQPEQKADAQKDAQKQQQSVGKETQSAAKDVEKQQKSEQPGSEQMDRAQQAMKDAQSEQSKAEQALKQGDFDQAKEHQKSAAEKLREASEAVAKAAEEKSSDEKSKDQQDQKGQEQQQAQSKDQKDGKDGKEGQQAAQPPKDKPKGDPLAAKLLDREEETRKARQRLIPSMQGKPTPVDRDW